MWFLEFRVAGWRAALWNTADYSRGPTKQLLRGFFAGSRSTKEKQELQAYFSRKRAGVLTDHRRLNDIFPSGPPRPSHSSLTRVIVMPSSFTSKA